MHRIRKIERDFHTPVPTALEFHGSGTELVPNDTSEPAIIVDVIDYDSG